MAEVNPVASNVGSGAPPGNPEQVRSAFFRDLTAGLSPDIELFLSRAAEAAREDLLIDLVRIEFEDRVLRGMHPTVDTYCRRFPGRSEGIRAALAPLVDSVPYSGIESTFVRPGQASFRSDSEPCSIRQVGRYRLTSLLGRGGFGEVWKGTDTALNRPVAVKILHPARQLHPGGAEAFLAEGRKLAQLKHPGIVQIYDVGREAGCDYLVCELLENGTAAELLRSGPMKPAAAAGFVAAIAEALHYAHTQDLVHRDVKPGNILLDRNGHPRLADFGLAISEREQLAEPAGTVGTWAYMSPEQLRGESHLVDARSDIYSLGVILYQTLTGRLPFIATTREQYIDLVMHRPPRPLRTIDDSIPPPLEKACLRCLSKPVSDRYTTAADLARDLRTAITSRRSSGKLTVLLSIVLVAALVVGALWIGSWVGERRQAVGTNPPSAGPGSTANSSVTSPDRWNPLFEHSPVKLVWPAATQNSDVRFVPGQEEVWVTCEHLGLLELGRTDAANWELRSRIFQQDWDGGVGLFVGFHNDPAFPDQKLLRTIGLRGVDALPGKPREILITSESLVVDAEGSIRNAEEFPIVQLPMPEPADQVLAIKVHDHRLKSVVWGGQEYPVPEPDDPQWKIENGRFGIRISRTTAVFRKAALFITSDAP